MMDCISFIDGGAANGVGFFVGDLFITAGHVIEHGQKFITYFRGEKIELSKSAAIYLNCAGERAYFPRGFGLGGFCI